MRYVYTGRVHTHTHTHTQFVRCSVCEPPIAVLENHGLSPFVPPSTNRKNPFLGVFFPSFSFRPTRTRRSVCI